MIRFTLTLLAAQMLSAAVNYSYDAAGRLTRIDYGGGGSIVYTYDKAGNLLSRTSTTPPPGGPIVVSALPASGAAATDSFTFQFAHSGGAQNLAILDVLINDFLDGRHACYLAYVVSISTLVLVDDAGDGGGPFAGSVALGNPATVIQNSQCAVSLTSASGSGNNFSLGLNITFKPVFGGNRIQYLAARDTGQGNTDWQAMGVRQVAFTQPGNIAVTGANPQRIAAAAGAAQTLTFSLTDTKGTGDFGVVDVLMNNFLDGHKACYLAYVAPTNTLLLVDDAGDAGGPFAGNMVLNGGAAIIQNSYCMVSGAGSSAVTNGNTLTLTLNVTAKTAFIGNRVIWVAGRDRGDVNNTGWQAMGTWSVQ